MTMTREPTPQRMIYVIEAENGLFKIGSSRVPQQRFAQVAAHSPCKVRLVAIWAGAPRAEQQIHQDLDPYRSHHEWFRKEGAALVFFQQKLGVGITALPAWAYSDRPTMPGRWAVLSEIARKRWAEPEYRARMLTARRAARPPEAF